MIGPSSGHTAGAVRIGWLAHHIAGKTPARITLRFRDPLIRTYSGHATDRGLVAGLLGYREDDERVRGSLDEAARRQIRVAIEQIPDKNGHPGEMVCDVFDATGRRTVVSGVSVGGGSFLITSIDGAPVPIDGFSGGCLARHNAPALPRALLAHLAGRGFWVGSIRSGNCDTSSYISFVPGPEDPGEQFLLSARSDSPDVLEELRWIPPIYPGRRNPAERKPLFTSAEDLLSLCARQRYSLPEAMILYEQEFTGLTRPEILAAMARTVGVMREAARIGLEQPLSLIGGFVPGDDGKAVWTRASQGRSLVGGLFARAIARALAVGELNASMGKIVAAPTAGSCGVLPGVVLSVAEHLGSTVQEVTEACLVAAGIGAIIGYRASFNGDVAGCQGEVGIASAMAASAATYLAGGSIGAVTEAAALAIKNILGLACDPAAGPVEVPCIKRNAGGAANALCAAEMALAGVKSAIPLDEVILALKNVQDLMPEDLRDNTMGGLGSTPTAARMKALWAEKCKASCR